MITNPTAISTVLVRPNPLPGDWNWAVEATQLWLNTAENLGIIPQDTDYNDHGEYIAALVLIDGTWYELEVRSHNGQDEVHAVPTEA